MGMSSGSNTFDSVLVLQAMCASHWWLPSKIRPSRDDGVCRQLLKLEVLPLFTGCPFEHLEHFSAPSRLSTFLTCEYLSRLYSHARQSVHDVSARLACFTSERLHQTSTRRVVVP